MMPNPNPIVRVLMALTVFFVVMCYTIAQAAEPVAKLTTKATVILNQQLDSNKVNSELHDAVTCLAKNMMPMNNMMLPSFCIAYLMNV